MLVLLLYELDAVPMVGHANAVAIVVSVECLSFYGTRCSYCGTS
jgi:hypothetical protein